jgi:hypothetical protein
MFQVCQVDQDIEFVEQDGDDVELNRHLNHGVKSDAYPAELYIATITKPRSLQKLLLLTRPFKWMVIFLGFCWSKRKVWHCSHLLYAVIRILGVWLDAKNLDVISKIRY